MSYQETLRTIKANYTSHHLKGYSWKRRWYIRFANTWITIKSALLAMRGWAGGTFPDHSKEDHIFKAWFSQAWVIEMNKW